MEKEDRLTVRCVHGTYLPRWEDTINGTRSLLPGGLRGRRVAAPPCA